MPAAPGERPARMEVWDLALGTPLEQLPDAFAEYACGTNGGPPSAPLKDWREMRRCRPEPSGLREVYFRYDDELEYWAKANNLPLQIAQFSGTKTYGFPITVSALLDEAGTLRGIRLVSDPRGDAQNRDEAYLLRNFLTARFGRDGWSCEQLPPEGGETPFDGILVKERCSKRIDAQTTASLATRHLRKAGQRAIDPHSGRETSGQFESNVRFELVLQQDR
ncbi:MAG: hypothetical protein IT537_30040 [Hyphomicrobiales bacterium]|nr:hypothetical protein [Hyphomicrobiales bacterium]